MKTEKLSFLQYQGDSWASEHRGAAGQGSPQAPHQALAGWAPQQQRAAPPAEAALIALWAAIRAASSHPEDQGDEAIRPGSRRETLWWPG